MSSEGGINHEFAGAKPREAYSQLNLDHFLPLSLFPLPLSLLIVDRYVFGISSRNTFIASSRWDLKRKRKILSV